MTGLTYNRTRVSNLERTFHMAFAIFILLWLNSGIFSYVSHMIPAVIKFAILVLWFLKSILNKKYINIMFNTLVPFTLLLVVIYFFGSYEDNKQIAVNGFYTIIIFNIGLYYMQDKFEKERKVILGVLLLDVLFLSIRTIVLLNQNPYLARYLSTGEKTREVLLENHTFQAVGGFGLAYGLVIFSLTLLFVLSKTKKNRIVNILMFVTYFWFVVQTQFVMAFIMLTLFLLVLFLKVWLFDRVEKKIKYLLVIALAIILLLIVGSLSSILEFISRQGWVPQEATTKFSQLSDSLDTDNIEGTALQARVDRYKTSIDFFLSNKLVGSAGKGDVGGHSTWLDMLGLFGLLSLPYFIMYISACQAYIKRLSVINGKVIKLCWLCFGILGIFNTIIWTNISICLGVLSPFFLQVSMPDKKQESGDAILPENL